MDILRIENVEKSYYNHKALDGVSFNVGKGKVFGLLGPNGAGKTTLIRIITQITNADSGKIFFNDERLQKKHIPLIGYLPEERGLYKKMKVGEQAIYLAQLKGMEKKDALDAIKFWFERFEIESWWNKKVQDLSKGMQQKIQFITTVLHEPELLILDEPFSGFDPINTELIKGEIKRLNEKGTTVIFSTHNMGSVEEICDDIALIHKSRKILGGNINDIKENHKKGIYKIHFKGNWINFTNALWTGFELIEKSEDGTHLIGTVKATANQTTRDLIQSLNPEVTITKFEEVIPSMNEIFIDNVQKPTTHE